MYDNWKVTLLPIFLENSELETGQRRSYNKNYFDVFWDTV